MSKGPSRPGDRRGRLFGRRRLAADSPLVGGPVATERPMGAPVEARAGAEEAPVAPAFDPRPDDFAAPPEVRPEGAPEPGELRDLRELLPTAEQGRTIDDWGRSERVLSLFRPLGDFYYRY